jgi:hypothetical protein
MVGIVDLSELDTGYSRLMPISYLNFGNFLFRKNRKGRVLTGRKLL